MCLDMQQVFLQTCYFVIFGFRVLPSYTNFLNYQALILSLDHFTATLPHSQQVHDTLIMIYTVGHKGMNKHVNYTYC